MHCVPKCSKSATKGKASLKSDLAFSTGGCNSSVGAIFVCVCARCARALH